MGREDPPTTLHWILFLPQVCEKKQKTQLFILDSIHPVICFCSSDPYAAVILMLPPSSVPVPYVATLNVTIVNCLPADLSTPMGGREAWVFKQMLHTFIELYRPWSIPSAALPIPFPLCSCNNHVNHHLHLPKFALHRTGFQIR